MRTDDVLSFYGSRTAAARAIGITRAAVWQWGDIVPAISAMKYARVTGGRLKFNPSVYLEAKKAG